MAPPRPHHATFNQSRKRDQMTPEEHGAYRAHVVARQRSRRAYRAQRLAEADQRRRGHPLRPKA